jgi:site-specific DNA-cytosine methylase
MRFFDEPDKSSGKVTFKYQDEVVDELDWNVPEDREKIVQRAHRGIFYDKNADDFHAAKKWKEQFDQIMDKAGQDDEAYQQLIGMIEGYTGRKMTTQEKVSLADDLDNEGTDDNPLVKKLSDDVEQLKKSLDKREERELIKEVNATHKKLGDKFDGADGRPKYDADAVAKFIAKEQFYLPDIERNYE